MIKKKRKKMKSIVTRRINFSKFKINKPLFKQAAALAKYKHTSIVALLADYLTISVVSECEKMGHLLGIDKWIKYCETAWEEINAPQKPLPRINKRALQIKKEIDHV